MSLRLLPCLALALVACGGTVVFDEGEGGSGQGGSGATVGAGNMTTGANGSSSNTGGASSSSSASGSVGGAGGSSSASVSTGSGGFDCGNFNYADCLGASDSCVPVFDDFCCSTCFPGECADCVDLRFVACTPRTPQGPKGTCGDAPCGFIPTWACDGSEPNCNEGCFGEAGCVEKEFCEGEGCGVTCDTVRPGACGPVGCNATPPECLGDDIPEAAEGCWTGWCIPAWVCGPSPL